MENSNSGIFFLSYIFITFPNIFNGARFSNLLLAALNDIILLVIDPYY